MRVEFGKRAGDRDVVLMKGITREDGEGVIDTVQRLAAVIVQKDANLPPGQAVAKVFREHPDLYEAYRAQAVSVGPHLV